MSTVDWVRGPAASATVGLSSSPARIRRAISAVARSPAFWQAQAMVCGITVARYASTAIYERSPLTELSEVLVSAYVFPIIYASLYSPEVGGLLTAFLCILCLLPGIAAEALHNSYGFLPRLSELIQVGTGPVVALVLSRLVTLRSAEQRQAMEMAEHLASLRQQVILQSIQAQEDERERIARDLHDETIQALISLCHGLDRVAAGRRLPSEAVESLKQLRALAEHTVAEVRRLSRDLRPALLDNLGLVAAVKWLVADLAERQGIRAKVEVTGSSRRLPPETELHLFRIVQEALRNVEKHSGATLARVSLDFGDDYLEIGVRDDGKGFDPDVPPNTLVASGKLGLVGMRERADLVAGVLGLQSSVGQGTSVTVRLDTPSAAAV